MSAKTYEVAIGNNGRQWFVGVRPPLTEEQMYGVADTALKGWWVEFDDPDSTVFHKYTFASKESTVSAAKELIGELESLDGVIVQRDFTPVDMRRRFSPFTETH